MMLKENPSVFVCLRPSLHAGDGANPGLAIPDPGATLRPHFKRIYQQRESSHSTCKR